MLKWTIVISLVLFYTAIASQPNQTIFVKGQVIDSSGKPIEGASIRLTNALLCDTTDIDGYYTLTNLPSNIQTHLNRPVNRTPYITGNFMHFSIDKIHRELHLSAFSLSGRCVGTMRISGYSPGNYSMNLLSSLNLHTGGIYILQARLGNKCINFGRSIIINGNLHTAPSSHSNFFISQNELSQTALVTVDTIVLSKPGLRTQKKPLHEYDIPYALNFKLLKNKAPYFNTTIDLIQNWAIVGEEYCITLKSQDDDDDFTLLKVEALTMPDSAIIKNPSANNCTISWKPENTGNIPFSIRVSDLNGAADTLDWHVNTFTVTGNWQTIGKNGFSAVKACNIKLLKYNGEIYIAYTTADTTKSNKFDTTVTTKFDSITKNESIDTVIDTIYNFQTISVQRLVDNTWEYVGQPFVISSKGTRLHVYDFEFDSLGTPYISVNGSADMFRVLRFQESNQSWVQLGSDSSLFAEKLPRTGPEIGFSNGHIRALYWGSSLIKSDDTSTYISNKIFIKEWVDTAWTISVESDFTYDNDAASNDYLSNGICFDITGQSTLIGFGGTTAKILSVKNDSIQEIKIPSLNITGINTFVQDINTDVFYFTSFTNNKPYVWSFKNNKLQNTGTFYDAGQIACLQYDKNDLYVLMMKYLEISNEYLLQVLKNTGGQWLPVFGSKIDGIKLDQKNAFGSARYNISMKVIDGVPYVAFVDKSAGSRITVIKYTEK